VSRNVCNLGPYNTADARMMLQSLASRRSITLDAQAATCLVELSGGHAGLLKTILSLLWGAYRESGLSKLIPLLNDEPEVQIECQKVWGGLPESEQATLCAVAGGTQTGDLILRRLRRKGLLREDRLGLSFFSPLFADFVRQQLPPVTTGTVVRRSPRVVQIGARRVEGLTEMEFEVLCYLYERQGQVCTKDELIEHVYRQQYERMQGGVSDATLHTLISRLREKIEPERGQPRYVVTVRGEGYKFVEPEE
jgi:DNA-binding winged helix-turn-helix (wHTH) protein